MGLISPSSFGIQIRRLFSLSLQRILRLLFTVAGTRHIDEYLRCLVIVTLTLDLANTGGINNSSKHMENKTRKKLLSTYLIPLLLLTRVGPLSDIFKYFMNNLQLPRWKNCVEHKLYLILKSFYLGI